MPVKPPPEVEVVLGPVLVESETPVDEEPEAPFTRIYIYRNEEKKRRESTPSTDSSS